MDARLVDNVVDERGFGSGINTIALTYDYALKAKYAPIMTAVKHTTATPALARVQALVIC